MIESGMATRETTSLEAHIAAMTPAQMLRLASELIDRARGLVEETPVEDDAAEEPEGKGSGVVDWNRYRGILKHGPDPLEYQRAIRAEWDGRP